MTGRATGANARPAIIRIASNRRMATLGFTILRSHRLVAMERTLFSTVWDFRPIDIDRNQTFDHDRVSGFGGTNYQTTCLPGTCPGVGRASPARSARFFAAASGEITVMGGSGSVPMPAVLRAAVFGANTEIDAAAENTRQRHAPA
jgi:hypothetical protein